MRDEQSSLRVVATEDGAAILDAISGEINTLNTTGAYIWRALERGDGVHTIAINLARATGTALSIVEEDVATFLTELKRQHLWPC